MKRRRDKKKKDIVIILIGLGLIVLIILLFVLLNNDLGSDSSAIYGDRLDGISSVKISNSDKEEITKNIEESDKTESVEVSVQGKILNVNIIIKKDTSRDDAKALANLVTDKLSDDEKKFYDIQIFIDKEDDEAFPIIGYRHHGKTDFSWTLDR